MSKWMIYAFASMFFAGFTSVIAKMGLKDISADLGLAIRTIFVFAFVLSIAAYTVPTAELKSLTYKSVLWLALSAVTTALSWIFYYRAIKDGEVSTVALIDKGSVLIAVAFSVLLLGEALTWGKTIGAAMIVSGLIVIARF